MARQISLAAKDTMWVGNHRELLVTSFIRQIEEEDFIIPTSIQSLVFRYYPKFENIEFLRYSQHYCSSQYDEGHTLRTNMSKSRLHCSRIFAAKIGFNEDIHLWKIKYLNENSVRGGTFGSFTFGAVGIITNNKAITKYNKKTEINSANIGISYYWDKHIKAILSYSNGVEIRHLTHGDPYDNDAISTWHHNDAIIVLLNCNAWTLSFFLNEKHCIGTIKIKPYLKYYPVVQFYCPDDQYIVSEYV